MLVLPYLAALILVPIAVHRAAPRLGLERCWSAALLGGAVIVGVLVVGVTELLSLFAALTPAAVAAAWGLICIALIWVIARGRAEPAAATTPPAAAPRWSLEERLCLAGILLVLVVAGVVAMLAPPNNWDTLTYHLPRQVRWIQQHSVAHFATHNVRQIAMPPLAEFIGLQALLLSGGDRGANLVQWAALALSALCLVTIAREAGLSRMAGLLAAVLFATIPMAYVQASNGKNDLVLTLWVLAILWLTLRAWRAADFGAAPAVLLGAAWGLLLLTKGTGAIIGLPLAVVLVLVLAARHRPRLLAACATIALVTVALNAGHSWRNFETFGNPLGPTSGYGNETRTARTLGSNLLRNAALHLALPSAGWNDALQGAISRMHEWMRADLSDPRTTYRAIPFEVVCLAQDEDRTGAPLQFVLIASTLTILVIRPRILPPAAWAVVVAGSAAVLLFCLLLKWQPWHARLHLPMMALLVIVPAALLTSRRRVGLLAGILAIAALTPVALWNTSRPLIGSESVLTTPREAQRFNRRPQLHAAAEAIVAAAALHSPRSVAFLIRQDDWEYPLERMLLERCQPPPRFASFEAYQNLSRLVEKLTTPDLVIGVNSDAVELAQAGTGARFVAAQQHSPYTLYLPAPGSAPIAASDRPPSSAGRAALFLVSLLLAALGASCIARRTAADPLARFWIVLAALALIVGVTAQVCSFGSALTPHRFLIVQAVLTALIWIALGRMSASEAAPVACAPAPPRRDPWLRVIVGLTVAVCILSAADQALRPLAGFDERMYHASRAIYWLQNQSVFPYATHNPRQVVFPFGGELGFFWPVLFARSEWLGRVFFWLAFPLLAAGTFAVARELQLGRRAAAAAALLAVTTPTVQAHSIGLKPDLWLAVFALGAAFWCVRALRTHGLAAAGWAGVFTALALNVKLTGVLLVPLVLLCLPWRGGWRTAVRCWGAFAAGGAAAALGSGLLLTLTANTLRDGHPLGPAAFRATHRADANMRQIYTHLWRTPLVLFELPWIPSAAARERIERTGAALLSTVGAAGDLPWEENPVWPGRFRFEVGEHATRYSLGGLLWLPAAAIALIGAAVAAGRGRSASLAWAPALLSIGMLGGLVLLVRWMGGGPERFWIVAYALGVPVTVAVLARPAAASRTFRVLIALLLLLLTFEAVRREWGALRFLRANPVAIEARDEPLGEVVSYLAPGAHILLVGAEDLRDYPLFLPREGFAARVTPCPASHVSPAQLIARARSGDATHILIADDRQRLAGEAVPIANSGLADALADECAARELPLSTRGMRLFELPGAPRAVGAAAWPPETPLVVIGPPVRGRVGIQSCRGPGGAGVEVPSADEGAFVWLGTGPEAGMQLALLAADDFDVDLAAAVSPGPTRSGRRRTLRCEIDDHSHTAAFVDRAVVRFPITLRRGRNLIRLWCDDPRDLPPDPAGDPRDLIVGVHEIRIEPRTAPAP